MGYYKRYKHTIKQNKMYLRKSTCVVVMQNKVRFSLVKVIKKSFPEGF